MDDFLRRANDFFANVPDAVRRHRLWIWPLFIVASVLVISGADRFRIDMTMEAYFQADDPAKLAYDRFRDEFGSDEVVFLSYRARDGDVFSDASLRALQGLHRQLRDYRLTLSPEQGSGLDHIREITSLINVSYMQAEQGVLLSTPFIGEQLPVDEQARERLRQRALSHPDYPGVYVSDDSRYASIVIRTDLGATRLAADGEPELVAIESGADGQWQDDELLVDGGVDDFDMVDNWQPDGGDHPAPAPRFEQASIEDFAYLMHAVEPLLQKPAYRDHLEFHPVGGAPIMTFFNDEVIKQLTLVFVASGVLILVMLWLLFRSLSAVVWSLAIIVISFLWVVGLIGWSGALMTMMINIIVFLVLAVGVADAVHILSGYLYFRNEGEQHEQALRSVFKKSGLACFLTSVTTSIGLLALTLVPIVPVRNFGIFAAVGVLMAFLLTIFILPLMLDLWSPVKRSENKSRPSEPKPIAGSPEAGSGPGVFQRGLRSIEHVGYSYPRRVVALFAVFTLYLVVGIFDIRVDTNMIALMPEEAAARQSVDVIDQHMAGSNVMDILFDAGEADAFQQPDMLRRMEALEQFIRREYPQRVGKIASLVNISKDANKSLHDDDPAMYKIPEQADVLAQSLFMFNSANPEDRAQFVSDDYSKTRMTITLKNAGSFTYVPMIAHIQTEIDRQFDPVKPRYPQLQVQLTGAMSLMLKLVDYISWSQIKSFAVALAVISALLLVVFGSKRIGFIALIPNLLPVILAFGLMGHWGIPLDTDTLLIAPIIIGIAVDDTIHFLNHYRAGILQGGSIASAIRQTIREAGQAIAFTSIILSVGFLVFLLCNHTALRNFGILSALAILFALFTDLFLLPALCVLFKADFGRGKAREDDCDTHLNNTAEGVVS